MKSFLCFVLLLCLTQDINAGRLKALLKEKHCKSEAKCESSCKSYEDTPKSCDYDPCEYEYYGSKPRCYEEHKNKKGGSCDKKMHHFENPAENEDDCHSKHPCYDYGAQYPSYDYGTQYPNYNYATQYPTHNYNYAAPVPSYDYKYATQRPPSPNYNYATQCPPTPNYNYATQCPPTPNYNYATQQPSYDYNYAAQYPGYNYEPQKLYTNCVPQNPSYSYDYPTAQNPNHNTQYVANGPGGTETRCVCTTRCECSVVPQNYPQESTSYGTVHISVKE